MTEVFIIGELILSLVLAVVCYHWGYINGRDDAERHE